MLGLRATLCSAPAQRLGLPTTQRGSAPTMLLGARRQGPAAVVAAPPPRRCQAAPPGGPEDSALAVAEAEAELLGAGVDHIAEGVARAQETNR